MGIEALLTWALWLAGVGQVGLVLATPVVVFLLDWRGKTDAADPMIRSFFWIYAGYILGLNLAFGIISLALPAELAGGTALAVAVTALITAYWGVRLALQFFTVHGTFVHTRWISRLGEAALTLLFVYLTAAYGTALAYNLGAFGT